MDHIRLIIFDFDGTLGDTRGIIVATMQQTLGELGLPVPAEQDCIATIGLPLRTCYERLVPGLTPEQADRCADAHHRIFDANKGRLRPTAFPHVAATLDALHRRGFVLTVASSRTSTSLGELLGEMGIARYFSHVLGAEDVTRAKPDPEPVLQTLRLTGMEAAATLVVGDMAVDVTMGRRAGCHTCGVTYGNGKREELAGAGAEMIIDGMDELARALGGAL